MSQVEALTSSSTSSDLLSQVRQHHRDAWRRFVRLYAPLVYGWCRRAGVQADDAADVLQEVFASVLVAIADFRHDGPGHTLRGWLRVITRNKLHDHYRRRGRAPGHGLDLDHLLAQFPEVDADESSAILERHALVRRAAELVRAEFAPRTWQAFWGVAVEGQAAADVAGRLGMTAGAVRQAKYMVLRRLREELRGEVD